MLKATLFGTPQIQYNNNSLNGVITGRTLALFIYLVVTAQPQDRSHLADLLWSGISEQEARQHLRGVLYSLRKLLGDYLIVTRDTIAFAHQQAHWIDVHVFASCLANEQTFNDIVLLQSVLKLYQGEFLADFYVQNAPLFEAWLLQQKQQFHNQCLEALLHLSQHSLKMSDYATGLKATRRVLQLEPWQEEAHRIQMRLLVYSGQRLEAISQYATCRQVLQDEYGVEPEWATTQLFRAIEAGELITSKGDAKPQSTEAQQVNWDAVPQNRGFVGRHSELEQLYHWVIDDHRRAIGLFGLAGQGKSALAAELVMRLNDPPAASNHIHPAKIDAIIWSTLTTIPSLSHLLRQWAERLAQLERSRERDPFLAAPIQPLLPSKETIDTLEIHLRRLLVQLRHQRVLLVIDAGEAIYTKGGTGAEYQPGWEAFDEVLRRLAENEHQSTLLLLSRIAPPSWESFARHCSAMRSLTLSGLTVETGSALLQDNGADSIPAPWSMLVERCAGHAQTLITIRNLLLTFGSDLLLSSHLEETVLAGTLFRTLQTHFTSLATLEQAILLHLALTQKPQTVTSLWRHWLTTTPMISYLEALQTLQRHQLLCQEASTHALILSPLVRQFVLRYLIDLFIQELTQGLHRLTGRNRRLSIRTPIKRNAGSGATIEFSSVQDLDCQHETQITTNLWHDGRSAPLSTPLASNHARRSTPTFYTLTRYSLIEGDAPITAIVQPVSEHLITRWGVAGALNAIQRLQQKLTLDPMLAGRFGLENLTILHQTIQRVEEVTGEPSAKENKEQEGGFVFFAATSSVSTATHPTIHPTFDLR